MTGILRSSQLWRRVLVMGLQQQNQKAADIFKMVGATNRFFAEQPERVVRNTSKVLSAEKKGSAAPTKDKITLHGADGSLSITSLEDAQKLAKRRGLKLVKEKDLDGKSQRPVYK